MNPYVMRLALNARAAGGRALLVGGAVRDELLGATPKDQDVELYGVPEQEVESFIKGTGAHVVRCGRSFPAWKAWTDAMGQGAAPASPVSQRLNGSRSEYGKLTP